MNALFEAIYNHAISATVTDFIDAIGGRFTYGEAIEGGSLPYAVFFGLPASNEDTFSETINDVSFQINIYTDGDYTEAGQIAEYCRALFDGITLIVAGSRDITLIREMETPPWRDSKRWVASIEFNGLLMED